MTYTQLFTALCALFPEQSICLSVETWAHRGKPDRIRTEWKLSTVRLAGGAASVSFACTELSSNVLLAKAQEFVAAQKIDNNAALAHLDATIGELPVSTEAAE